MTGTAGHPNRLASRIMWGLAAGVSTGLLVRLIGSQIPPFLQAATSVADQLLDPFGQIFLRMLFFVVIPLVFGSLALGIVQLGRLDKLGPLAGRTFLLFAVNMSVGAALGLIVLNLVDPGNRIDESLRAKLLGQFQARALELAAKPPAALWPTLTELVDMFMPRNLLKAVVEFQILPLISFAFLTGLAGTQLSSQRRARVQEGLEILCELMTRIVNYAMLLAPYAVAAMVCGMVIKTGPEMLGALLLFAACVVGTIAFHLFVSMSILLRLLSRRRPAEFFRAVRPVLVTAFSTSSSNATLPTSIQVSRETLGVSASTAGFVLPLGATVNMSGTALYEGCVVLFIAQVYGVDLSLAKQGLLLLLTVLSAVAVAGIPGASLPLIMGLLANFGLPPEGIALIIGIERPLDMIRTVLNVAADLVTACIVDERVALSAPASKLPGQEA